MRNLVLLRGCPGVGKTTFLEENDLRQYTISPDAIRLMFQTPVTTKSGQLMISQSNDNKVWDFVFTLLDQRMRRGEFTIVDATHSRSGLVNRYRELCQKYRYRCTVIDFDAPIEEILKRNKNRDFYKFVPEEAILKIHERLKTDKVPSWVKVIKPEEFKSLQNIMFDFTGKYDSIIVFGDIHGCFEPLKKYFSLQPYSEKNFYVFTGDYFDRGIQNVEVFRFLYPLIHQKNVLCLTGNHELHFHNYIHGEEIKSKEFIKTLEQFKAAGITDIEIKDFYQRLGQLAYFKYDDKVFVITHGGIPTLPSLMTASLEYIKGVGKYEDSNDVDKAFVENTAKEPTPVISIHGHRNVFKEAPQNTERTFNLCSEIEFGQPLRILNITPGYDYPIFGIENPVFDTELKPKQFGKRKEIAPLTGNDLIDTLSKDRDIYKKDLGNNIFSYQFKEAVFHRRRWTPNTMKARGLFIDVEKQKIVARSYDKFFNWGEFPHTESPALKESLVFPVKAYRKYNGFLGLLSVHNDEWFIASKTANEGEYSGYFKTLLKPYLTEELKDYIKAEDVTFVFEVLDPTNDPHIIDEIQDVVLLDIVKNTFEYQCLDYLQLICIGTDFHFRTKCQDEQFKDWESLYTFKKQKDDAPRFEEDIEGWVFIDATGFMVKYKTQFYKFWKQIRNLQASVVKFGGANAQILNRLHSKDEMVVYNELIKIPTEKLEAMSIIQIRKLVMDNLECTHEITHMGRCAGCGKSLTIGGIE